MEELRIQLQAPAGEGKQRRGIVGVLRGQHPGGRAGGLLHGPSALQHRHLRSAAIQLQRQRQTDDAAPCDHYIGAALRVHRSHLSKSSMAMSVHKPALRRAALSGIV